MERKFTQPSNEGYEVYRRKSGGSRGGGGGFGSGRGYRLGGGGDDGRGRGDSRDGRGYGGYINRRGRVDETDKKQVKRDHRDGGYRGRDGGGYRGYRRPNKKDEKKPVKRDHRDGGYRVRGGGGYSVYRRPNRQDEKQQVKKKDEKKQEVKSDVAEKKPVKRDVFLTNLVPFLLEEGQVYWMYPIVFPEDVKTRTQRLFINHRIRGFLFGKDNFIKDKKGVVFTMDRVISTRKLGLEELTFQVDEWVIMFREKIFDVRLTHHQEVQNLLIELVHQCIEGGKDFQTKWKTITDGKRRFQLLQYEQTTHELNSRNIEDWFLEKQVFKCFNVKVVKGSKTWFMDIQPSFKVQKKYPNGFDLIKKFRDFGYRTADVQKRFRDFSVQSFAHRQILDQKEIFNVRYNMIADDPVCFGGSKHEGKSFIDYFYGKYERQLHNRGIRKEDIIKDQPMLEVLLDKRAGRKGGSKFYIPQLVTINCGIGNEEAFLQSSISTMTNKDSLSDFGEWVDFLGNKSITDAFKEFGIVVNPPERFLNNHILKIEKLEEEKLEMIEKNKLHELEKAKLKEENENLRKEVQLVKRNQRNFGELQRTHERMKRFYEEDKKEMNIKYEELQKKMIIELDKKSEEIETWKLYYSFMKKPFFKQDQKYNISVDKSSRELDTLMNDFKKEVVVEREKKRRELFDFNEKSNEYKEELKKKYFEKKREEEKEKEEEEKACPICFDKKKNVALGCGHVYCEDCSEKITECSFCRKKIDQRIKLYT